MKKSYISIGVAFCFLAPVLYVLSIGSPGKTNLIATAALLILGFILIVSGLLAKDGKTASQKATNLASSSFKMLGIVLGIVFLLLVIVFIYAWSFV